MRALACLACAGVRVLSARRRRLRLDQGCAAAPDRQLRSAARPLGVATYAAVPQLPDNYRAELPSPRSRFALERRSDQRSVAPDSDAGGGDGSN